MPETLTAPAPTTGPTIVPNVSVPALPLNTSTPTESAPAKPGSPLEDAFDALDRYASDYTPEPAKVTVGPQDKHRQEKKSAEKSKSAEESKKPAESKPDEEKAEVQKPEETPKPNTPTDKPKKPADFLREKLSKTEQERDTFKAELEKFKTAKPAEDPEKKTMAERLEAQSKELDRLREEMKLVDFSKSDDFKAQYEKPFIDAYQDGVKKITSFKITGADGTTQTATQADFDKLLTLNDNDAADMAKDMFGDVKASMILIHRERVLEKAAAQQRVLEDYRKKGSERDKFTQEQMAVESKKTNELWQQLTKDAQEKHPDFFKPSDGDDKGNELLTRGYARMQAAFNGGQWTDKDGHVHTLTKQQLVELHNEMFNKAAGFNTVIHRKNSEIAKLKSEVETLKKDLEAYKESEPTKGEGESKSIADQNEPAEGSFESVLSGLDKLAKDRW